MATQMEEKAQKFLQLLTDVDRAKTNAVDRLKTLADDLDQKQRDMNIAKTSFASSGILASVLTIGGIVAAPFTAGASLAVTAAGVGVGAASGLGGLATSIANGIINSNTAKEAEASIAEYQKKVDELMDIANILCASLHGKEKLEELIQYEIDTIHKGVKKQKLENFLRDIRGFGMNAPNAAADAQTAVVKTGQYLAATAKLATVGRAAVTAGRASVTTAGRASVATAGTAAATAGRGAARVLTTGVKVAKIGGAALSVITVPLDIATVISNAMKIHNNTPSQLAEQIRKMARNLETHEILE